MVVHQGFVWRVTRAAVQVGIEETVDAGLPDPYDRALFAGTAHDVFERVFIDCEGAGKSLYESTAA